NANNFINELELKDERRGFHLAVCRNVTSSNTLQALEKQLKLYESRDKWENLRNLKAPEYNNGLSYEKEDWKDFVLGRTLDAFESEYNPIQQIDCGKKGMVRRLHNSNISKSSEIEHFLS
ncbi:14864_t:CDS:2, partial [Acaulospora colombiana]